MSVNLLFKIAAVGILVSVLGQVLKHSGRGRTGVSCKPCRAGTGAVLGAAVYQPAV